MLKDGDVFLSRIFFSDEMWVHHNDPMKKIRSMEWHYQSSPEKKKKLVCKLLLVKRWLK
jgi:hypothetical protein